MLSSEITGGINASRKKNAKEFRVAKINGLEKMSYAELLNTRTAAAGCTAAECQA